MAYKKPWEKKGNEFWFNFKFYLLDYLLKWHSECKELQIKFGKFSSFFEQNLKTKQRNYAFVCAGIEKIIKDEEDSDSCFGMFW